MIIAKWIKVAQWCAWISRRKLSASSISTGVSSAHRWIRAASRVETRPVGYTTHQESTQGSCRTWSSRRASEWEIFFNKQRTSTRPSWTISRMIAAHPSHLPSWAVASQAPFTIGSNRLMRDRWFNMVPISIQLTRTTQSTGLRLWATGQSQP